MVSWHSSCIALNFLPTASNHQTLSSLPVSLQPCLHFPWSCPAAKNIFLPLRPEHQHDHLSIYRLSASHSVLTSAAHTDRSGVERGSPERQSTKWHSISATVENWGTLCAMRQIVQYEVWGCEECEEGGTKSCTHQTPTAASQRGNESWC